MHMSEILLELLSTCHAKFSCIAIYIIYIVLLDFTSPLKQGFLYQESSLKT